VEIDDHPRILPGRLRFLKSGVNSSCWQVERTRRRPARSNNFVLARFLSATGVETLMPHIETWRNAFEYKALQTGAPADSGQGLAPVEGAREKIGALQRWDFTALFILMRSTLCPALTTRLTPIPNCIAQGAVVAATTARPTTMPT
jgi:hypothetical protein